TRTARGPPHGSGPASSGAADEEVAREDRLPKGRRRGRRRRNRSSRGATGAAAPASLRGLARLPCSRPGFEQLAPYVEERPTDEHGSAEQDESCNDGHRDRYAGKLRDEAHAFTTNITHGHGGLR